MIAVYTRISRIPSVEKRELKNKMAEQLKDQLERAEQFIKYKYPKEEYRHYPEPDKSGYSIAKRPQMQKLLSDVVSGEIKAIIISDLSRGFRNARECLEVIDLLDKHKCKFISLKENFDTGTAAGKMLITMLAAFAEFELQTTRERLQSAYITKLQRGVRMPAKLPYGYNRKKKTNQLVINPHEAKGVREAYAYYLKCGSINKTRDRLNHLGYKTKVFGENAFVGGKPWNTASVKTLLHNLIYTGRGELYRSNRTGKRKKNAREGCEHVILQDKYFPAIIDESTFNQAQEMMKRNRELRSSSVMQRGKQYLLNGGLLKCSCGKNLYGSTSGTHNRVFYYRSGCKCGNKLINADKTEQLIIEKLHEIIKDQPNILDGIIQTSIAKINAEIAAKQQEISTRENSVKHLKKEQGDLINLLKKATGKKTIAQINADLDEVNAKLALVDDKMGKEYIKILKQELMELTEESWTVDFNEKLDALKDIHKMNPEDARKVLKTIFTALVYDGKSIQIHFNGQKVNKNKVCGVDLSRPYKVNSTHAYIIIPITYLYDDDCKESIIICAA